jgi:cytochrome c553
VKQQLKLWRATNAVGHLSIVCGLLAVPVAHAQDSPLGMTIATQGTAKGVPACISCHGTKGEGNAAAGFPRLAGLSAGYLATQLAEFASGQRQNSVMQPFAKIMSLDGRNAVADYFSKLPEPAGIKSDDPQDIKPSDAGAWLATRGRWESGLPACVQCHGPGGVGVGATFPPLAGQPATYIASQLHGWKKGTRPPGPLALMPVIASRLSDADITAVADYYAGKSVSTGSSPSNRSRK